VSEPTPLRPHADLDRYYDGGERGRREFVRDIFDRTAGDYDRVERMMALGTGAWYRRRALERSGLTAGARVLDVAIGTGLVAREAVAVVGSPALVTGLDPSAGMLVQARRSLVNAVVLGTGERLPFADASFDFLSLGYALRHLADLQPAFEEFRRVLRPGGTVCLLEITPPRSGPWRAILRLYVRGIIPLLTRITTRHRETALLWRYFWDTMEGCVPPARVLEALAAAGFAGVDRFVELGLFSEYTGRRPALR
jgi:demethylmenaquinone methyltransferase/2-methoxy-6-polyprenyl-1,4-benzoquinol methylase